MTDAVRPADATVASPPDGSRPVLVPPSSLRRALDRLNESGARAVRLDSLVDAIRFSTHDPGIGMWRALVVPVTSPTRGGTMPSVTVALDPLRHAVTGESGGVAMTLSDDGVFVSEALVERVDDQPAPPEADTVAPIDLPLPASGPSVASVNNETRLVLDPELVEAFAGEGAVLAHAFSLNGRWYVSAMTGGRDIAVDPALIAEVASYAEGSE